jgi:large subunit ribosomal protein L24
MNRIKAGDTVRWTKGRDRQDSEKNTGKVRRVLLKEGRAIVEGVNVHKKHARPGQQARQAGIIDLELPIQLANLALVCSKCGKPTRVGFRVLEDGSRARYCKKCGELT